MARPGRLELPTLCIEGRHSTTQIWIAIPGFTSLDVVTILCPLWWKRRPAEKAAEGKSVEPAKAGEKK